MKRLLKDKRGEGFVDVCVLVLAIAMVLALVVRIAPVFVAKQKVLRLSDLVLIDLAMPRGYASFHVLDVWGNRAFLSDEKDKLVLCEMTLE